MFVIYCMVALSLTKKRILLLSGYDAASHRHWRDILIDAMPQYHWTVLALPDRHFFWRARGNGLTYAFSHAEQLSAHYDLIIATSMVDLCSLRGFVPALASIPTLIYFHENQFAYPMKKPGSNIVNVQLTSIYSALCADRILFNSQFNMDSFYQGAQALLKKMPDGVPRDVLAISMDSSTVLPVPIYSDKKIPETGKVPIHTPVEIVWNHRWEYDKQPEVFFDAINKLEIAGVDFRLHVMGQSFREIPGCFNVAAHRFEDKIITWGHQPSEQYNKILDQADIVVSTAIHDFQGLSLLQAISRGCIPVAPDRVAYPEYVPASQLYDGDSDEATALFDKLRRTVESSQSLRVDVSRFYIDELVDQYHSVIESLVIK